MTRLEFNEVLVDHQMYEPQTQVNGFYDQPEDAYLWNNLLIYFNGIKSAYIKGMIPLPVAQRIYNMYSYEKYGFRPDRHSEDIDPSVYAIDNIFRENMDAARKNITSATEYHKYLKSQINELRERKEEDKYLTTYAVDTKSGFEIFMNELDNYYKNAQNKQKVLNKDMD